MKADEIKKLIQLRQYTVEAYKSLDGGGEPSSMIKQQDVAVTLSTIVKSMDDLLREYVKFD